MHVLSFVAPTRPPANAPQASQAVAAAAKCPQTPLGATLGDAAAAFLQHHPFGATPRSDLGAGQLEDTRDRGSGGGAAADPLLGRPLSSHGGQSRPVQSPSMPQGPAAALLRPQSSHGYSWDFGIAPFGDTGGDASTGPQQYEAAAAAAGSRYNTPSGLLVPPPGSLPGVPWPQHDVHQQLPQRQLPPQPQPPPGPQREQAATQSPFTLQQPGWLGGLPAAAAVESSSADAATGFAMRLSAGGHAWPAVTSRQPPPRASDGGAGATWQREQQPGGSPARQSSPGSAFQASQPEQLQQPQQQQQPQQLQLQGQQAGPVATERWLMGEAEAARRRVLWASEAPPAAAFSGGAADTLAGQLPSPSPQQGRVTPPRSAVQPRARPLKQHPFNAGDWKQEAADALRQPATGAPPRASSGGTLGAGQHVWQGILPADDHDAHQAQWPPEARWAPPGTPGFDGCGAQMHMPVGDAFDPPGWSDAYGPEPGSGRSSILRQHQHQHQQQHWGPPYEPLHLQHGVTGQQQRAMQAETPPAAAAAAMRSPMQPQLQNRHGQMPAAAAAGEQEQQLLLWRRQQLLQQRQRLQQARQQLQQHVLSREFGFEDLGPTPPDSVGAAFAGMAAPGFGMQEGGGSTHLSGGPHARPGPAWGVSTPRQQQLPGAFYQGQQVARGQGPSSMSLDGAVMLGMHPPPELHGQMDRPHGAAFLHPRQAQLQPQQQHPAEAAAAAEANAGPVGFAASRLSSSARGSSLLPASYPDGAGPDPFADAAAAVAGLSEPSWQQQHVHRGFRYGPCKAAALSDPGSGMGPAMPGQRHGNDAGTAAAADASGGHAAGHRRSTPVAVAGGGAVARDLLA